MCSTSLSQWHLCHRYVIIQFTSWHTKSGSLEVFVSRLETQLKNVAISYLKSGYSKYVRPRIWIASHERHSGPTWDANQIWCFTSFDATWMLWVTVLSLSFWTNAENFRRYVGYKSDYKKRLLRLLIERIVLLINAFILSLFSINQLTNCVDYCKLCISTIQNKVHWQTSIRRTQALEK